MTWFKALDRWQDRSARKRWRIPEAHPLWVRCKGCHTLWDDGTFMQATGCPRCRSRSVIVSEPSNLWEKIRFNWLWLAPTRPQRLAWLLAVTALVLWRCGR